MWAWCCSCLGVDGVVSRQPLTTANKNLRLRRSVVSRIGKDTDEEDEGGQEVYDEVHQEVTGYDGVRGHENVGQYVVQRQPGSTINYATPTLDTVLISIQPPSEPFHRPDLDDGDASSIDQLHPDDANHPSPSDSTSIASSSMYSSIPRTLLSSSSALGSLTSSSVYSVAHRSPNGSLWSLTSDHSSSADVPSPDITTITTTETSTSRHRLPQIFMTPEAAAKTPDQPPPPAKVVVYNQAPEQSWVGQGVLSGLLNRREENYAGEYRMEGQTTPVKLKSEHTMHAITSFEARADTKDNPVWYSFGTLVVTLHYYGENNELEVSVVQVTELPAGKATSSIDLQVMVYPSKHKTRWVRGMMAGPRHDDEDLAPTCTIKVRKLEGRSLVVSAFVSGRRMALGHGVVPNLEAQPLTGQTFPLQLRLGSRVQDHLGKAQVALSCCERTHGYYTFTVDVMQVKGVKVQLLGSHMTTSFKARAEVWVQAILMVEGREKKTERPTMPLKKPRHDDQGWEVIFKHGCSFTLSIPKNKLDVSAITLKIHGRSRYRLASKEALLGTVQLGPEELFGGQQNTGGIPSAMNVPGDPLDTRLTHWGQALRRMAKIEMWHRLQI